jgi:hypothetical protein
MKNFLILLILLLGVSSCTDSSTDDVSTEQSPADTLFASIKQTRYTGIFDTLDYTFLVNTISKEEYQKIRPAVLNDDSLRKVICGGDKEGGCMEAMEKYYISKVSDRVQRTGKMLTLALASGPAVLLQNNLKEDDDYEVYQFLQLDPLGNYIVAAFYMESYDYLLINSQTGKITHTIGFPVFSPDQKKYVSGNYDMIAAFTFNGIDFITQTRDSAWVDLRMDFKTWGCEEIKWKDDSTLYVKQKSQIGEEPKEENNFAAIRIRRRMGI